MLGTLFSFLDKVCAIHKSLGEEKSKTKFDFPAIVRSCRICKEPRITGKQNSQNGHRHIYKILVLFTSPKHH